MTAFTINIPNHKAGFFKKLFTEMGCSYVMTVEKHPRRTKHKARLYDPETGEYLNDKTMKVIEDVRSGKEEMYEFKSIDDFKAWCEAL